MRLLPKNLGPGAVMVLALGWGARAEAQTAAFVTKSHNYVQTGTSAIADDSANGPFSFSAAIDSSATGVKSFDLPDGTVGGALVQSASSGALKLVQSYSSQAVLDTVFPSGSYRLNFNGAGYPALLSGDAYPNPPIVTADQGTWTGGNLVIDPNQPLTLTLTFSTNYAAGRAYLALRLIGTANNFNSAASSPSTWDANQIILRIPAGALAGFGNTYSLSAVLDNAVVLNPMAAPGYLVGALYETSNRLTIQAGAVAMPAITAQPQSLMATPSSAVKLSVTATGEQPLSYQWFLNGVVISGAVQASYSIASVGSGSAGIYTVAVSNAVGTVTSSPATVTLAPVVPTFLSQPASQTIVGGTTVAFAVNVAGIPAPTLQWFLNGAPISGATSPYLLISSAGPANVGTYSCSATNANGTTLSNPAALAVTSTANVGRLINLSFLSTASQVQPLTLGFVTGGSGTTGSENVLLRGVGPGLGSFGIAGVLSAPNLSLIHAANVVASVGSWGGNSTVASADLVTGAFPLNASSQDAALVTSCAAGSYNVQVSTASAAASGLALGEIYDDTGSAYTLASPRLINLSVLNQLAAGKAVYAGFVIGGITSKTVLIRAIGPGLASFGVSGAISDPQFDLHTGAAATDKILISNHGWGGNAAIAAVAVNVGAFALSGGSSDSAVVTALPPGSYTAVVSSASGAAGMVLVEVYEVP